MVLPNIFLAFTAIAVVANLLFYLFDQLTRHDTVRAVNAKVKSNKKAFTDYHNLLMSNEFKQKLRRAVDDPTSDEAHEVLGKLMSVMSITETKSNFFGATASKLSEVRVRSMVRKYGPCAAFITIAPDDVNNPTLNSKDESCLRQTSHNKPKRNEYN
jgi:hypothetical protein